ncbi:MAG: hypothetical protein NXI16_01490 [Alphaproteobacteria bacterium]|nr:hypothetical protein [Alphaproteobacteria bacterium]
MDAKRRQPGRAAHRADPVEINPHLLAKRLAMCGDPNIDINYPLEVLHARGLISEAEKDAGHALRAMRKGLFGDTGCKIQRYGQPIYFREQSDASLRKLRVDYDQALAEVRKAGRMAVREVERVAVFLEWPEWFIEQTNVGMHGKRQDALKAGLRCLAKHFGFAARESAS